MVPMIIWGHWATTVVSSELDYIPIYFDTTCVAINYLMLQRELDNNQDHPFSKLVRKRIFIAKPVVQHSNSAPQSNTRLFFCLMMQHGYLKFTKKDSDRVARLLEDFEVNLPLKKRKGGQNTEVALQTLFGQWSLDHNNHKVCKKAQKEQHRIQKAYASRVCPHLIYFLV